MFTKATRYFIALIIMGASALHAESLLGPKSKASDLTLLVVPTRTQVVQLAFDLSKIRAVALVTYEGTAKTQPYLHYWTGAEWANLTIEELTERGFLRQMPQRVVVIGDESMVAPALMNAVAWSTEIHQIPSIKSVDIVNFLHPVLKFNNGELEWLAGRHSMKIKDLNEEKRNLDPYAVPRGSDEMDFKPYKKRIKHDEKPAPVEEQ